MPATFFHRARFLMVLFTFWGCICIDAGITDLDENKLLEAGNSTIRIDSGNTICRGDFNFGHQLGYMYAKFDSAYFNPEGSFSFLTGFIAYYTPEMPMVKNPEWKKRTILMIPLEIEFTPCKIMSLQFDITDLFIEFPYKNYENMGGKSPRVRTKILLLKERRIAPAIALTLGVKWSSAKPYTMWHGKHNYYESNGLAGAGTGVADYTILFTLSKKILPKLTLHSRIGLIPVGSPMGVGRQADEIPYGLSVEYKTHEWLNLKAEIAGMYNGLPITRLAHYSVFRFLLNAHKNKSTFSLNLEKGLTSCSDQWVAGVYWGIIYKKPSGIKR
ncbi:MAG TPA: hypothetical protein VHO70_00865 [Chitinispirillaceae bacterium]|nr:hypothetical protein [Chitinispirillaceae bacterium]